MAHNHLEKLLSPNKQKWVSGRNKNIMINMTMIISGTFVKEESNKTMASLFSSILEKCVLAIVGIPVHLIFRSCDYDRLIFI